MNTPWNLLLKLRTALGDRPVLGTLVFSLTASLLAAQTGPLSVVTVTGSVAGRVFNQATGVYLEGARIEAVGTERAVYSTPDGSFQLAGLPMGKQTLAVSYAGLDARTVTVIVHGSRTEVPEIGLTSGIYVLDKFVVPGEREGNALAITQQRNAANVKNVVSADAFGNVADENIGNFLLRVPGVTGDVLEGQVTFIKIRGIDSDLNAVTVDGTRAANGGTRAGLDRGFEIDTIPADFVDKIEVTKAPTPDMDADSIGGSVNLKTKSALNQKGRVTTFKAGASYGTGRKTIRPFGSFMYSDLVGRKQNLGVMVTANYSWASNPRDVNFGPWEATTDTSRPAYFTLSTAGEDYFEHKRGGLGVRFDYRLNENSTVYLNVMYSQNHDRLFRRRNSFSGITAATIVPGWTEFITDTRNITYGMAQVDRWRGVRTYNIHLGGEQKFAGATFDYNFNVSPSTGYEKRTNVTPQVTGVGIRFDRGATIDDPAGATFSQISGRSISDPANMTLGTVGFTDTPKKDRIIGGQVNFRKTLALQAPTYLKTGFRFRAQTPKSLSRPETYNYVGPGGAQLARFLDQYYTYQPEALRGTMPSVRFFHIPTLVHEWQTKPDYFTINKVTTLRQRLVADRQASESVFAAYAMGHTQLGRLGILAGLRIEETRIDGSGTFQFVSAAEKARRAAWVGIVTDEENLRRTQVEYGNRVDKEAKYRNVFPGLHFRYELGSGLQARASSSTGIGRPSFNTIIPNDSVNDTTQIVTSNNTGLKPQSGTSFDLALEYYLNPAGLVSVGLFQKNVRDFIYTTDVGIIEPGVNNGFNGEYVGYLLRTQVNGSSARMRGLEINFQQQFTQLPGFWRGFGLYANCTWLNTAGTYESQAVPHSGNAGISYIDHGWTVRVQENFTGRSVAGPTAIPATQLHNYGKKKVDLNVSYRLNRKLTLFADVINVFGDSVGGNPFYYVSGRKRGADKFNPEIKAGLSGRF